MSDTIVDMPKVAQMLDAGWKVRLWKNGMGSYEVSGWHPSEALRAKVAKALVVTHEAVVGQVCAYDREFDWTDDDLITDDFTPEQALTRLAYKVHGEII